MRLKWPFPACSCGSDRVSMASPPSSASRKCSETALRLDKMAYTLQRKLGPEYVAQRQGAGGSKVSYIEAHRAFDLANEVFGFNGWNTTVKSLEVDFVSLYPIDEYTPFFDHFSVIQLDFDENTLRWSVGVSAIVRVSLVDGAYREDVGCGKMDNCRYKAEAIDKVYDFVRIFSPH